ncbi:DUF4145 domain-containing protein [Paenibacillus anaericanus]|uniref:DUF4145 domain-containing protein n=1 Tax=Paenibacillus anaericanus TaxID=170367 RepID=A0A433Y4M1_9BACL|nr:DUF4145 domain-containing protein [Paenibacillus anaericanus]RUT43272.1 DUF4145 domain-containing protein [Paenibacillus anaericanus]
MKNDIWTSFLNPEILKANLIKASLYIAAFEMLKDSIIDHPKTLFTDGFNEEGWIVDENYKLKVLSRNKSPLYASLDWFKEMETIKQADIEVFNSLKEYRNKLSHEMASSIFKGFDEEEFTKLFSELIILYEQIEKWWVINFELAIDPEINIENVDDVYPGSILMLKLMLDVALSGEEESWKYYNEYMNGFKDKV